MTFKNLILELFNELIEILFQQKISDNLITIFKQITIFDNDPNNTKITEIDYQLGLLRNIV